MPPSAAGSTKYKSEEIVVVALVNLLTTILVARPGLNVKNLGELLALAKDVQAVYSSWGNGSLGHVAGESFKSTAEDHLPTIPYQGAAPAAQAVLGGQVDLMFMPGPLWISFRDCVTTIGVMFPRRFENVPTLTEQGLLVVVVGLAGESSLPKTPKPVVDRLDLRAIAEVMAEPETKERIPRRWQHRPASSQEDFAGQDDQRGRTEVEEAPGRLCIKLQ